MSFTTGLPATTSTTSIKLAECIAEFLDWYTMTSCEHFASSSFTDRILATVAYRVAEPAARRQLDRLSDTMNGIPTVTLDALQLNRSPNALSILATHRWSCALAPSLMAPFMPAPIEVAGAPPQATLDALLER
jgi:hypothetical protein